MGAMQSQRTEPATRSFTSIEVSTFEDLIEALRSLTYEHEINHVAIVSEGSMYSAFHIRNQGWILENGSPEERMVLSRGQWLYSPLALSSIPTGPYTVLHAGIQQ